VDFSWGEWFCRHVLSELLFSRHSLGGGAADEAGLVGIIAGLFNRLRPMLLHGLSAAPEAVSSPLVPNTYKASVLDWLKYTGSTYRRPGLCRLGISCASVSGHPPAFWRGGLKLGLFGFAFGFGGWLRNSLLTKRLGRFFAARGGVNRAKLALFGFALSRVTKCPIGRNSFCYIVLCAFDFCGNWLCFFK